MASSIIIRENVYELPIVLAGGDGLIGTRPSNKIIFSDYGDYV